MTSNKDIGQADPAGVPEPAEPKRALNLALLLVERLNGDINRIEAFLAAPTVPAAQDERLRKAAQALLDACFAADMAGDLAGEVDGSLMEELDAALSAKPQAPVMVPEFVTVKGETRPYCVVCGFVPETECSACGKSAPVMGADVVEPLRVAVQDLVHALRPYLEHEAKSPDYAVSKTATRRLVGLAYYLRIAGSQQDQQTKFATP